MRCSLFVLTLYITFCGPSYAGCIPINSPDKLIFEGVLRHKIFPGAPNYEDVRKGDRAEPVYILELNDKICVAGDDFIDKGAQIRALQIYPAEAGEKRQWQGLVGTGVRIFGISAFGAHTVHHRAPLVVEVGRIEPEATENDDLGVGRISTVRGFYAALSVGDGVAATSYVIPEKRAKGPFSAREITTYYGSLLRPLELVSVDAIEGGYRVSYRYTKRNGTACDGRADVSLVTRGVQTLIGSIRSLDGC